MANIVVSAHNFLLRNDLSAIPPFYEGFIKGLEQAGNNVLYFQWSQQQFYLSEDIPESYLDKIEKFNPDIFICFNNQFWNIVKRFDVPIVVFDVDSPNAYCNIDEIRENKNRYHYVVIQSCGAKLIKDSIGCDEKKIIYIPPFTEIKAKNIKQDINISFCGTNWFWVDFKNVNDFIKTGPTNNDRQVAQKAYELFKQNPILVSKEIYKKFKLNAEKKLHFDDLYFYGSRVSGIKRLRILTELADLGLEVRGNYWKDNLSLIGFPEVQLSYNDERCLNMGQNELFYNRSKISVNTKHIQAKSGFSWRVCDILASNACLLSEFASDISNLGFKIPMFSTPHEARELCIKLLKNENMRKDIVAHSQEVIEKRHRFKHVLADLEEFVNINLHSNQKGSLEIETIVQNTANSAKNKCGNEIVKVNNVDKVFASINKNNLTLFGKLNYKLSRHFYKRIESRCK